MFFIVLSIVSNVATYVFRRAGELNNREGGIDEEDLLCGAGQGRVEPTVEIFSEVFCVDTAEVDVYMFPLATLSLMACYAIAVFGL